MPPRSLVLLLALAACSTAPVPLPEHEATVPAPNADMAERVARLAEQVRTSEARLVFVGDSITHRGRRPATKGCALAPEIFACREDPRDRSRVTCPTPSRAAEPPASVAVKPRCCGAARRQKRPPAMLLGLPEPLRPRRSNAHAKAACTPISRATRGIAALAAQSFADDGRAAWDARFVPRGARNLGISGDRTEHVLWRLRQGHYDRLRPRLVVLLIGTNNTGHRMDAPEKIRDGVVAILREMDARWAKPRVLLLAIFPRGERPDDPMRRNNAAANALLRDLADGKRVRWLDLGARLLASDGTLTREIMPDLLHLSPRGYELWAEGIEAQLDLR